MDKFEVGTRVRVNTFEGVVTDQSSGEMLYVQDSRDIVHRVHLKGDVVVLSLDPPGFPPRLGDVWLDSAKRPWLVINQGGLRFVGQMGNTMFLDALNPKTLFYRDGKIQIP